MEFRSISTPGLGSVAGNIIIMKKADEIRRTLHPRTSQKVLLSLA